jgi:hypothetical protein
MKVLAIGGILVFGVLAATTVFADGMRCGGDLVEIGDTEYEVVRKCGQPSYKEANRWIYDRGVGRYIKILKFGNGKLLFIDETLSHT